MNDQAHGSEERQPDEWEKVLEDVTIKPSNHELLYDPHGLTHLKGSLTFLDYMNLRSDVQSEAEVLRQTDLVRKVIERKLKGLTQECLHMLLSTGATQKRIAKMLGVSEDKVQRSIKIGIKQIRYFLESRGTRRFPVADGTRPAVRAAVFSLDTDEERSEFQNFLNRSTIIHISYRGDDLFREVLVIYQTGRSGKKLRKVS